MAEKHPKSKYRPKPNYWLSNVSVTLLLFLAGLLGLSWLHSRELIDYLKENVNLTVELNRDVQRADAEMIAGDIRKLDGVKEGTVQLITKEEGFADLKSEFGEDFLDDEFHNTLQDMIILIFYVYDVLKINIDVLQQ